MPRRLWIIAAAIAIAAGVWFVLARRTLDLASSNPQRTWQPVVLMPWVNYGYDFAGASTDPRVDAWFARLEQDGVKAVAWFLFADGRGSLVFDPAGHVTALTPGFRDSYRASVALAKKHKLQIIWVLTDFEVGMPAQTDGSTRMFGHADLLEDADKRGSFIQNALVPILQEDTSQIAAWIAINEPEHLLRSGRVSESAIRAFVHEVAAAIKRYHPGQRIGLADADLASMIEFSDIGVLDFLVFHHYGSLLPPPVDFIPHTKPVFIGEFNLNYPPGSDLEDFVRTAKGLGYAGVWPWSLRDRLDASGTKATEAEPQFDAIGVYASSMLQPQLPFDDRELSQVLLLSTEQRIAELAGKPEFHQSEARINANWAAALTKIPHGDDLQTATERVRMHTYLQRETSRELDWLHTLEQKLRDKLDKRR